MKYLIWLLIGLALGPLPLTGGEAIADAIANQGRSDEDRERDKRSLPQKILTFCDVEPGMRVADLFSGDGYYSELLSHVVGDAGAVIAHNNKAYVDYLGVKGKERYLNNRLKNVSMLQSEAPNLNLPGQLDLAIMVMSYHDFFYQAQGWDRIDSKSFMEQVYRALKPDGKLLIIDHATKEGMGITQAQTLHRIDEAFTREDIEKYGFQLEKESDVLRNPDDPREVSALAPSIRGRTDKFVFLFKKVAD